MRVNADSLLIRAAATSTSGTLNDLTTDLIMANKQQQTGNTLLFQAILTDENDTPEFNGFNTCASRQQGVAPKPKTHVNFLPLIDAKPSDPSTIVT